jgi:hypothetical protein
VKSRLIMNFSNPSPLSERIDLSDSQDVASWSNELGISEVELHRIVQMVGNSSLNVREHVLLRR